MPSQTIISLYLSQSLNFGLHHHQRCQSESPTPNCSTRALSLLLYKTLKALQYPCSLCNGLLRHLVADICTEQRGQLELQPKLWLCSCQLERETQRKSSLPFTVQLSSKNNHWWTHFRYYDGLHVLSVIIIKNVNMADNAGPILFHFGGITQPFGVLFIQTSRLWLDNTSCLHQGKPIN